VILDVLHYVDLAAQEGVLQRVRDALKPAAAACCCASAMPRAARLCHQPVGRPHGDAHSRPHRRRPVGPSAGRVDRAAATPGFLRVQSIPMSEGTPFANVLLVADLEAAAA
jgi:hypothetical protein